MGKLNNVTQLDEFIYRNFRGKMIGVRFGFFIPEGTINEGDGTKGFIRRRDFKDMLKILLGKKSPLDMCYF